MLTNRDFRPKMALGQKITVCGLRSPPTWGSGDTTTVTSSVTWNRHLEKKKNELTKQSCYLKTFYKQPLSWALLVDMYQI